AARPGWGWRSPARATGCRRRAAGWRRRGLRATGCWPNPRAREWPGSLPFERSLLPHVDEAEQEHAGEQAHLDQAQRAKLTEHRGPGHDEDDFQVEDDELDRDEVVAHVELHARVLERVEAALVRRQLLAGWTLGAEEVTDHQQRGADTGGNDQEQQGRQVFGQHSRCSLRNRPPWRP